MTNLEIILSIAVAVLAGILGATMSAVNSNTRSIEKHNEAFKHVADSLDTLRRTVFK